MANCLELLCWIEKHPGLASWLQAIGALIALVIAIGVPWKQKADSLRTAAKDDADQVKYLLRNLLDEMTVVSSGFAEQNGKLLLETPTGEPFLYIIPLMEHPFLIYEASTARLGQIPNDELRRLLITCYGHSGAFVSSVKFNNVLVERFEEAKYLSAIHGDFVHSELRKTRYEILAHYGDALKRSYLNATQKMQLAQTALKSELGLD
jgi:hypothetical protein